MIEVFIDPVLRAPLIGSMLMCLSSSLIGVIVFLKKRSLVGEALSHAAYPGVVISVMVAGKLGVLIGAATSCGVGLYSIGWLEKLKVKSDAALCFVLASFLGIGLVIASRIQLTHAVLYQQIQGFLYGQVVTMTEKGVIIYALLALLTLIFVFALFRHIKIVSFDPTFAQTSGISVALVERLAFILLILAVVIGIRCIGVVLMAGMLIAPPVAARQLTNRLSLLFVLSGLIGMISAYVGIIFSENLPPGPIIVLSASSFAVLSLLFAPQRGLLSRAFRIARFRWKCQLENILKACWKKGECAPKTFTSFLGIFTLRQQGWMKKNRLTIDGEKRAAHIVRLHRLWEVYLVRYLGASAEKVHRSAEEMEHIITPELEEEIITLIGNVETDPHQKPIPPKGAL